jgi:sugar lactone lactonase YvrE
MRTRAAMSSVLGAVLGLAVAFAMAGPASAEEAGTLLVVVQQGVRGIVRVNPTTGAHTIVSNNGPSIFPDRVAIGPTGDLFLVDQDCCGGGGAIFRVNPATGVQTMVSSGGNFINPEGIAIRPDGQIYVGDAISVIRVDPVSGAQTVITAGGGLAGVVDLAIGPDGLLYAQSINTAASVIVRVDPQSGVQTPIPNDPQYASPIGIAIARDGQIYLADQACCGGGSGVFRVNPTTGVATLIASGGFLNVVSGVAIGAGGELYVNNVVPGPGNAHVVRVDPVTGNQQVVDASPAYTRANGVTVVPGLTIADASTTEGNSGATTEQFAVTLAPWSPLALTVPFTTHDGTAHTSTDFGAISGSVSFAPADTTKTISVPIVVDRLSEPTETYTVEITAPPPVGLVRSVAIGTILDDDGTATLSIGDATVTESNSGITNASFPVVLSPASGQAVTVQYATANGTAEASADFQSAQGTLSFEAGQTSASISVPIVGDIVHEPDETFTVTLSNPTGGAAVGRAQALGTILDDDPAPTPTPVPPVQACTPRPGVQTTPVAGGGALQVSVSATPLNTQRNNPLTQIRFGQLQNAQVIVNGQAIVSGQTYTPPANTFAVNITVRRLKAGEATTVPFTVADGCGEWPTFVGGGTLAGF